jgi:hypothetical protein
MLHLPMLTIIDQASGAVVGDQIRFANSALARLIGLPGAAKLNSGEGLLLAPSSRVHTWGMSFPIDVIAMDRGWRVCRIWQHLPPWRICAHLPPRASFSNRPQARPKSCVSALETSFHLRCIPEQNRLKSSTAKFPAR